MKKLHFVNFSVIHKTLLFRGAGCGVKEYTCSAWCTGPTAASLPAVITAAIMTHCRERGLFFPLSLSGLTPNYQVLFSRDMWEMSPRNLYKTTFFPSTLERERQRGQSHGGGEFVREKEVSIRGAERTTVSRCTDGRKKKTTFQMDLVIRSIWRPVFEEENIMFKTF